MEKKEKIVEFGMEEKLEEVYIKLIYALSNLQFSSNMCVPLFTKKLPSISIGEKWFYNCYGHARIQEFSSEGTRSI